MEYYESKAENKVSLEKLVQKATEMFVKEGQFSEYTFVQISSLIQVLDASWRKRELASAVQQEVEFQQSIVARYQLQLAAHYWLHDDTFMHNVSLLPLLPVSMMDKTDHSAFMQEVQRTSSALLSLQTHLNDTQEQQNVLVSKIEKRLKWAAGANPALSEITTAFNSAVQLRDDSLIKRKRLATVIYDVCDTILLHEALRTSTSEATASNDASFLEVGQL